LQRPHGYDIAAAALRPRRVSDHFSILTAYLCNVIKSVIS
jgi:hypothetical protein